MNSKESFKDLHGKSTDQERTYFTYDRFGYSLGWDLATYQQDTILTRFGGYAGISFHLSFIPSKKIGIVAFSNENRAGRLPHLMANYVYNLIGKNSKSEDSYKITDEFYFVNNNLKKIIKNKNKHNLFSNKA